MSLQTKVIGRTPTDHGPYNPNRSYGKKFCVTLFGCMWESLHDNNNTAPAVWDGGDTITPNLVDWKKVSGDYNAWLMNRNKPATSEQYPFNGMGRVRLKKNLVEVEEGGETVTKNLLTQEMFEDGEGNPLTNTVYVIQYDFTLGEDITVPANCVLKFEGGSLKNGNLSIDDLNFVIDAPVGTRIFYNVDFLVGHPKIIHTSWWGISSGEESDNDFETVLNLASLRRCTYFNTDTNKRVGSILYIDNDIKLSRSIEATPWKADIKGVNSAGAFKNLSSYVNIYSLIEPESDSQSLITLTVQETNIYGVLFRWNHPINGAGNGANSILNLLPYSECNLDVTITNCGFGCNWSCHTIQTTGRGVHIQNCGFSITNVDNVTSSNIVMEGIICCITKYENFENDYGSASEDQLRRVCIKDCFFHTGRNQYALRLKQGEGSTTDTFKGLVFTGNTLDRGTRAIISTARTSGVLVTNNTFLFTNSVNVGVSICNFYTGSSLDGLIFSNNIVSCSGNNLDDASYYKSVTLVAVLASSTAKTIKNLLIANNSIYRVKLDYGLVSLCAINMDEDTANIIGVNFSNNIITEQKADSYRSLVVCNGNNNNYNIKNLVVTGNVIGDTGSEDDLPRVIHCVNTPASATFNHIRIYNNTSIKADAVIAKGGPSNPTLNPQLSDTTHWIDVKTDWEAPA